jgi:hypothetical protein
VHKGKPIERWGRNTSGLTARAYDSGVAGIAALLRFREQAMHRARLRNPLKLEISADRRLAARSF